MNTTNRHRAIRHGIKPPDKRCATDSPIETPPLPRKVIIPLRQHQGEAGKPLVKAGDRVLAGQKIAEGEGVLALPIHATVSGFVAGIISFVEPKSGQVEQAVAIDSDGQDEHIKPSACQDPQALSKDEILNRIKEAGVAGLGGAVFPTYRKLAVPAGKIIDALILNGCECEPCLSGDHRLMLEYGKEVLLGLDIIKKLVSPGRVYIAIEDNKADAIDNLRRLISEMSLDFEVVAFKSRYPAGAERLLVKALLGREIPHKGLPLDAGAIVQNVSTARAIFDAVIRGKPLTEQVVTVTGAVNSPKNVMVRLGTPVRDLIEYCGGMAAEADEVVLGGPMTGFAIADLDYPVTKGVRCVLVKEAAATEEKPCIRCGSCLDACPMYLQPFLLARCARSGRYDESCRLQLNQCFECGCCAYVCPAGIPITQYIKMAKRELCRKADGR